MDKDAIEQIAAALAHEVKNPLSLVRANIELLEQKDPEKNNKKNYEMIHNELLKINELIMQFLNLTVSNKEIFDLVYIADIIINIVKKYDTSYANINFVIKNMVYEEKAILGSENKLDILFNNIIKNSVEAINSTKKEGIIEITIKNEKNHTIANIKDNGGGILEEIKDSLGMDSFTTKELGTGLGILICKQICKEHNGEFSIKNTEYGCVVEVSFPFV
ncbi:MAG: HAMP domain-containing histidine kinase [Defluviitaleaceae bacterium]|nr:HAMP domain-containing histidine kinase [Defluviitaleaceae bacterium]